MTVVVVTWARRFERSAKLKFAVLHQVVMSQKKGEPLVLQRLQNKEERK
jgi:hypothetical protein